MISVVIPLYNKEESIASTLQSVYDQTYTDYEVLIVNDGSTDNSSKIVKDFIAHVDDRWVLISQKNSGVSAARNAGILAAKGEYVAFLDGDDLWDKDYLKTMAGLIAEYPDRSIYGLGCTAVQRSEVSSFLDSDDYYRGEAGWKIVSNMAFTGSSCCVNRADAIEVGLFDTRMTHGEDIDMWWRLMLLHGGAVDKRPMVFYIQDSENRAMNKIIPLEKHIPYYMDKYANAREINPEFRRFFDKEMIYRLYPYLFTKQYRKEARRLAKKLDYTQLKGTMHFRMLFPHIYRIYQKLTGK